VIGKTFCCRVPDRYGAGTAVFLASSHASFIAGAELFVDGGQAQI